MTTRRVCTKILKPLHYAIPDFRRSENYHVPFVCKMIAYYDEGSKEGRKELESALNVQRVHSSHFHIGLFWKVTAPKP
jgi:hypothetical protein